MGRFMFSSCFRGDHATLEDRTRCKLPSQQSKLDSEHSFEARLSLESLQAHCLVASGCKSIPQESSPVEHDPAALCVGHYPQLGKHEHIYVDFGGAALASQQQLLKHFAMLQETVLGNPHSNSMPSLAATSWVTVARQKVLHFFNASPSKYQVIFTANASAALKLVAESYPFGKHSSFLLCEDNHNSVNGIQCYAQRRGAKVEQVLLDEDLHVDAVSLQQQLELGGCCSGSPRQLLGPGLLAYPAQSNVSGVKHSLGLYMASGRGHFNLNTVGFKRSINQIFFPSIPEAATNVSGSLWEVVLLCAGWIKVAQDHGWDVLLDAAALVPTSCLDLTQHTPDYVTLSFYKMFGWPTGIGCLLAREPALAKMATRPWYSGGTVAAVYPGAGQFDMLPEGTSERFEDGTVNFASMSGVVIGLDYLLSIGMTKIEQRVCSLTAWLLQGLVSMKHGNGNPVVRLVSSDNMQSRGGTVSFILLSPSGAFVPVNTVRSFANERRISLRAGCMCNPGLFWSFIKQCTMQDLSLWVPLQHAVHKQDLLHSEVVRLIMQHARETAGVVRVSFGIPSVFGDVEAVLELVRSYTDVAWQ